jgi:hypothetical protein
MKVSGHLHALTDLTPPPGKPALVTLDRRFGRDMRRAPLNDSLSLYGSIALWTLADFSVSESYTQSVGLAARRKAATCTQDNRNTV